MRCRRAAPSPCSWAETANNNKKRPCNDGIIVTGSFGFSGIAAQQLLQDVMVEHRDRQVRDDKAVGAHAAKHPWDQDPHQRAGKKLADGACLAGADVRVQLPGVLLKNRAQVIKHVLLQAVLAVVSSSVMPVLSVAPVLEKL